VFFWFLGTSALTVWFVFRDDTFDYRVLALGALVPDLVDLATGGAWVMHSIVASIGLLTVVMVVARRGSVRRRRWLALPIGTFLHLVFDGAFNNTKVFWWPFTGAGFGGAEVPSLDRGALNIVMEVAGVLMLAWLWRTSGLSRTSVRARFVRTGHLTSGDSSGAGTC
jgi:hypothetical protein